MRLSRFRTLVALLSASLVVTLVPALAPTGVSSSLLPSANAVAGAPPSWVKLTSSRDSFQANQKFRLTAVSDFPDPLINDYRVAIWDITTGVEIPSPYGDTSQPGVISWHTADISFDSGTPHSYMAFVTKSTATSTRANPVVKSGEVQVARLPWSIKLESSVSHIGVNGEDSFASRATNIVSVADSVELTATASQDVSDTNGAYRIVIRNDNDEVIASCTAGATCVGQIMVGNSPSTGYLATVENATGGDVQATSNQKQLVYRPFNVQLSVALTADTTLTAKINQELPQDHQVVLIDLSTSTTLFPSCNASLVCSLTIPGVTGHTYQAVVQKSGTNVAVSNSVVASPGLYQVNLNTNIIEVGAGETATLTAIANQAPTGTLHLLIWDEWSNQIVKDCGLVATCTYSAGIYDSTSWSSHINGWRGFKAFVATVGAYNTVGSDVRASSGQVNLQPKAWDVTVSVDDNLFVTGHDPVFTITENTGQDVAGTYGKAQIVLYDETAQRNVGTCAVNNPATPCVILADNADRYFFGKGHIYHAYVGTPITSIYSTNPPPTNVLTISDDAWTARRPWMVSMYINGNTATVQTSQDESLSLNSTTPYPWYTTFVMTLDNYPSGTGARTCRTVSTSHGFACDVDITGMTGTLVAVVGNCAGVNCGPSDIQAATTGYVAPPFLDLLSSMPEDIVFGGSGSCKQSCVGDPVNPATGEYYRNETDLQIPGRLALSLSRSYSSKRGATDGVFGHGWSSNFDMKIIDPTTPNTGESKIKTRVLMGNGAELWFEHYPNSHIYTPIGATDGKLTWDSLNNNYVLKPGNDGSKIVFTSSGRLSLLADSLGSWVSFSRNSTSIIATMQDGRQIIAGLDANGRISDATGPAGWHLGYSYDVNGDLTSVTDTRGKVWRFGYDTTHKLTSTQSPVQFAAGVSSTNSYDTQGRVYQQIVPINPAAGGVTPQAATTTFTYTGTYPDLTTTVTDPDGVVNRYTFISGYLATTTLDPGGSNQATWTHTYDFKGNRVQTVDPDGVSTRKSFDDRGNIVAVADAAGNVTQYTYNSKDETTSETITDSTGTHVVSYSYNTNGTLDHVTSPIDATTDATVHYEYNGTNAADVTKVIDAEGRATNYTYYPDTGLLKEKWATQVSPAITMGEIYTYDSYGNVLRRTLPRGYSGTGSGPDAYNANAYEEYTYEPHTSLPLTLKQPANNAGGTQRTVATYAHDDDGHLTSITNAATKTFLTNYWLDGSVKSRQSPGGALRTFDYTAAGKPKQVTTKIDATTNAVETTTYNSAGILATVVSAEGNKSGQPAAYKTARTRTFYYSKGLRATKTSVPDPAGGTIDSQTVYDFAGRPWKKIDSMGRVTTVGYGTGNQVLSVTDNNGNITSYTYDFLGRMTESVAPTNGAGTPTTRTTYDKSGRTLSQATQGPGLGVWLTSTWDYNSLGMPVTFTPPNGNTGSSTGDFSTHYYYGETGSVVSVTNAEGNATTYSHNLDGSLAATSDATGRTVAYTYDADGNISTVTHKGTTAVEDEVTKYTLDDDGHVKVVETPQSTVSNPIKWQFNYDLAGRVTSQTDPLLRVSSTAYNLDGTTTSITTRRGATLGTITITPDALDRTTSRSFSDGSPSVSFIYNKDDSIKSATSAAGAVNWLYDTMGRPQSATRGTSAWSWTYNPDGSLATQSRPGTGQTETYTYDIARRRILTHSPDGDFSFEYDADGNMTRVVMPSGVSENYEYSHAGDLSRQYLANSTTTLVNRVVTRGADSLPTQVTTTRGGVTQNESYLYTKAGARLQGVCYTVAASCTSSSTTQQFWTYDKDGNRLSEKNGTGIGATTSWTYNAAGQPATRVTPNYQSVAQGLSPRSNWTMASTASTPAGYTLTNTGTVVLNAAGAWTGGKSATFTGTAGKYLAAATGAADLTTSAGKLTIAVWVKGAATQTGGAGIVCKGNGSAEQWCLDMTTNKYRLFARNSANVATTLVSTKGTDTAWHHVVGVIDESAGGRGLEIWVDGKLDAKGAAPASALASTHVVSIGARQSAAAAYDFAFNGSVGDVSIYHGVLAPDDIVRLATAGVGGTTSYVVDVDGNVTNDGTTTYTYNLENAVKTAVSGGVTHTYLLDENNMRVKDTVGAASTSYEWNPVSSVPTLATVTGTTTAQYRFTPGGQAVMVTDNGVSVSLGRNINGSVTDVANASGALIRSEEFTPFGANRTYVPGSPTASGPNPTLGFQGMLDSGTGSNSYTPARIYSSTDGQFMGADPAFMSSGAGFSAPGVFAGNNPVSSSDPTGEQGQSQGGEAFLVSFTGMIDGMTMDSTRTFRDVTHAADGAIDYSCDDNYRWSHATGFALINLFTLGRASAIAASARIGIKGAELTTALENMGREVRLGYQPQVVEVAPGKFVVDSYEALVRPVDASIHAGHVADWAAGHTGMAKSFLADSHAAVVADVADGVLPAASKVAVNVSRNVVRDPEGFLLIERGEKMYPQMSHELTESGGQLSEGTLQAAAPRMAADDLGTGKGPSTFLDTDKYSKYGVFDDGSDPWFGAGMYTWKYSKFEGNDLYRANGKVRSVTELQTVLKARGIRAGQDITMETYKWGISTTEKEMLAYRRMQKALSKSGLAGGKVKLQSVYWAKKAGVQGLDDLGLVIMGSFTFWV